jgi:hypothetical protein
LILIGGFVNWILVQIRKREARQSYTATLFLATPGLAWNEILGHQRRTDRPWCFRRRAPDGLRVPHHASPRISIRAVGTTGIARVEIHKNGQVVWVATPDETEVQLEWSDPDFRADDRRPKLLRSSRANRP